MTVTVSLHFCAGWLTGCYQSVMKYNYSSGVLMVFKMGNQALAGSRYQNYTRKLPQTKTPLLSLSLQGCKLLQLIIKKFLLLFNYRAARHM